MTMHRKDLLVTRASLFALLALLAILLLERL